MTDFHSPEFWAEQWLESLAGDSSKISKGYACGEFWDTRAGEYDRKFDEDSLAKIESFIDSLEAQGLFRPGMKVLDIGCGPGRHAAAFARRGGQVTAIDISPGMIERTLKNRPEDAPGSIDAEVADWREIDLAARGWEWAFGLVFARMTPAIDSPEALEKMMLASGHCCYLRLWSEKKASPSIRALWKMFTGEELSDRHVPFRYVFNYLLAKGFHPEVKFDEVIIRRRQPSSDAIRSFIAYFTGVFGDTVGDIDGRVAEFVLGHAVDGMVDETVRGWAANLTWTV